MRNPFIILRGICLGLLLYLNIVALGFAVWNIIATKSVGHSVNAAPIIVIVNAVVLYFFLGLSLAELFVPGKWAPQVMYECSWTVASGVAQLGGAIDITVNGPPSLCLSQDWSSACASSTLLVAVTWVSSSILIMYFCFLLSTAIAHAKAYPAIWGSSVCCVPWFVGLRETSPDMEAQRASPTQAPPAGYAHPIFDEHKHEQQEQAAPEHEAAVASTSGHAHDNAATSSNAHDAEPTSPPTPEEKPHARLLPYTRSESNRPPWAKSIKTRRGVDPPFAAPRPRPLDKLRSYWSQSSTSTGPAAPARARVRGSGASQYVEMPPDLTLPVITPSPSRPISYGIFPAHVADPDVPIHRHRISCWVTANNSPRSDRRSPPRTPPRVSPRSST